MWCLLLGLALAQDPVEPVPPLAFEPDIPRELVVSVREPLVALQDTRVRRVRTASSVFLVAGSLETVGGTALMLGGDGAGLRLGAGLTLAVGGLIHVMSAVLQVNEGARRHAAFVSNLAVIEGGPDAGYLALADRSRQSAERVARNQAFASGLYTGVAGVGAALLAAGAGGSDTENPGAALVVLGAIGTIHHTSRWRAARRMSADFETVRAGVPGPLP